MAGDAAQHGNQVCFREDEQRQSEQESSMNCGVSKKGTGGYVTGERVTGRKYCERNPAHADHSQERTRYTAFVWRPDQPKGFCPRHRRSASKESFVELHCGAHSLQEFRPYFACTVF